MTSPSPLTADQLARLTDPASLDFETTDDLEALDGVLGQDRAVEAVHFGIGIRQEGYNLFALGQSGLGKRSMIRRFLEGRAPDEPTPPDWVYVQNFERPHHPRALRLPAGRGRALRADMDHLIEELQSAIPETFESEEFRNRKQALEQQLRQQQEASLEEVQQHAREKGIAMVQSPMGIGLTPMRDGENLTPEQVEKLDPEERDRIKQDIEELQSELQQAMSRVPQWQREARSEMRKLNRQAVHDTVENLIDEVRQKHSDVEEVIGYLDAVRDNMVDSAEELVQEMTGDGEQQKKQMPGLPVAPASGGDGWRARYRVNLLVDHTGSEGAPILEEDHPTYQNLIGRIEHRPQFGALVTDFTMIKSGALHRCNGGYLILDVRRVLMQPLAWDQLKRVLRAREIRIETLGQSMSPISTVTLEPEPIPLQVKVVLVGERWVYYLLSMYDPEFNELFKVQADFDDRMERNAETSPRYARLIATLARDAGLRPFRRDAVARVMDRAVRLVEDSERLSMHLTAVRDLLHEADYWSSENGNGAVTADDVQHAIDAQIRRADRMRERSLEAIDRGTIMIDTDGAVVGQVNGLSVSMFGGFGKPSRLTARVSLGRGEVTDIEREVELGGPVHSKGVLILQGYLAGRFAENQPLSLKASLVFEQSYGGVDGDSASSAELYALLSALADVPIRQGLAVTGSVNQMGQVQAIGGVNEKIEGHFDVCRTRGLSGREGVVIPAANVKNLMLRQDVVEAVREGQFNIYAVETIDQGIEILTGISAGERDGEGQYPPDTLNARVEQRLGELADAASRFAQLGSPAPELERLPRGSPTGPQDRL